MTEQALRDKILLAIYHRRENLHIDAPEFCIEEHIVCESNAQRRRIFQELKERKYIKVMAFDGGDDHILSITSAGVDYAEQLIAKSENEIPIDNTPKQNDISIPNFQQTEQLYRQSQLILSQIRKEQSKKDPDSKSIEVWKIAIRDNLRMMQSQIELAQTLAIAYSSQAEAEKGKGKASDPQKVSDYSKYSKEAQAKVTQSSRKREEIESALAVINSSYVPIEPNKETTLPKHYHTCEESKREFICSDIAPCMGIENLSSAFIGLLESFKSSDSQMIGIFGSWGRGKTYFFNYIKSKLAKDKYDIVEFNAWKYQETPALWAYLFETIFNEYGDCCDRLKYSIWRKLPSKRNVIIFVIVFILGVLFYYLSTTYLSGVMLNYKIILDKWGFPIASITILLTLLKKFIANPFSSYKLIKQHSKNISFCGELGIQNEIENELEALLKWSIPKPQSDRKVLLFIDDIDRCPEEKIISIIDSLRTILENDEIKKRLIVVCAIDEDKLRRAITSKYRDLYDLEEAADKTKLKHIPKEQMDKLFLSGIKLRAINTDEKTEFLRNLISIPNKSGTRIDEMPDKETEEQITEHREDDTIANQVSSESLTEEEEFELLNSIIIAYTKEITPRQIRIIYYRFILARNILHGHKVPMYQIALTIFEKSMGIRVSNNKLAASYLDVIDTVVCY